ncbi:hypothetical protein [Burkholderia sp. AW49-1]
MTGSEGKNDGTFSPDLLSVATDVIVNLIKAFSDKGLGVWIEFWASASQCEGREFDPPPLHHKFPLKPAT